MRIYHTILFILFLTLPVLAQRALPVRVVNPISVSQVNGQQDVIEEEGEKINLTVSTTAVWNGTATSGGMYLGGPQIPPGKMLKLSSAMISSSAKAQIYFNWGQQQNFGNPATVYDYAMTPAGGGTVPIPLQDEWIKPGSNGGGIYVAGVWGSDSLTRSHRYNWIMHGTQITADQDYTAPFKARFIGTSITAGTGPSSTLNMYSFMLRRYMRDTLNYRVRLSLRAVSGSTSAQHETARQNGNYDRPADLVFLELLTNNGGQNVSTAASIADISVQVQHHKRLKPNVLVFILPPPYRNDSFESNLVAYRSALATYVSGLNDSRVINVSAVGSLWNSSTSSTFTTDGIHPNDAGNRRIYWAVRDKLKEAFDAGLMKQFAFPLLLLPMFRRRKKDLLGIRSKRPSLKPRIRKN